MTAMNQVTAPVHPIHVVASNDKQWIPGDLHSHRESHGSCFKDIIDCFDSGVSRMKFDID